MWERRNFAFFSLHGRSSQLEAGGSVSCQQETHDARSPGRVANPGPYTYGYVCVGERRKMQLIRNYLRGPGKLVEMADCDKRKSTQAGHN